MTGWTFNYNINTDYITKTIANNATVTQADSMAILSTTTATDGSAKIATRKTLKYSPGFGALV